MSNNNMLISQLYETIVNSIDKELYSNAVFFGERLISEYDTDDSRYILAKAYIGIHIYLFRRGKVP